VAIDQPIADAAGIKSDNGERIAHHFEPDGSDGFRPNGADCDDAGLAVMLFEFLLRDESREGDAIGEPEPAGDPFTGAALIAIPEDNALERNLHLGQGAEEHVYPFDANDLAGVNDEVAFAKG